MHQIPGRESPVVEEAPAAAPSGETPGAESAVRAKAEGTTTENAAVTAGGATVTIERAVVTAGEAPSSSPAGGGLAGRFGLAGRGGGRGNILNPLGGPMVNRCLAVFGLTVLLLLPLAYFSDLVEERAWLYQEAITNIAERWGGVQTVTGPALIIPYVSRDSYESAHGGGRGTKHLVVLPKQVSFSANLASQTRYKGIYRYVVYTTPVSISGSYVLPEDGPIADSRNIFLWDQAFFSVGVSDLKAIGSMGALRWDDGEASSFAPGAETATLLGPGFHAKAPVRPDRREYDFSMQVSLNGSGGIYFTPVGESTRITVKGDWPSPNFDGALLAGSREVTPEGFTAEWNVPHISRDYPQSGTLESYTGGGRSVIAAFTAGVSLHESVPLYRQIMRSVKYGVLFIGLTFAALLGFELLSRSRLHLAQYGLVGVAMCLFYLVLLSLAEHLAFWQAFALASAVCVFMNGLYIAAAFRSALRGLLIALLLATLYGVLYALLQTEEYAILLGTALVVAVVCVLMYLTRHLNHEGQADGGDDDGPKDAVREADGDCPGCASPGETGASPESGAPAPEGGKGGV